VTYIPYVYSASYFHVIPFYLTDGSTWAHGFKTDVNHDHCTEQIRTPITDLLKINHPILLAGMNVAAGPKLAAAVTNAGGLGVIGGVGYTPEMLREQVAELKSYLHDKNAPFGVDLLLPQVGGSARKTK
jgi:enoyl reductase-like protein